MTMGISPDLLQFLQAHTQLIEFSKFDSLSTRAENQLSMGEYLEFVQLLKDSDIDPIPYMTYIPDNYYQGESMTKITIPPNIKEIRMGAFEDCFWLKEVHLPGTVGGIHMDVFKANNGLEIVTFDGSRDQWKMVLVSKIYNDPLFKCGVTCNDGKVEYVKEPGKDWEIVEW